MIRIGKNKFEQLKHTLRNFAESEHGVTLPVVAISLLAMMGATGAAVDIGKAELVQAKLSNALDAAGLAVGATISTSDPTALATNYINANFPSGYLGATVSNITVNISSDNKTISLSATATVPNSIMQIFGQEYTTVLATSEITRASYGMELVLVMDNTGSMSSDGKLDAMKTAATNLINILYGSSSAIENLWVGLVPFSQSVNIGTSRSAWMDSSYMSSLNWGTTSWGGCVDGSNTEALDISDDIPSVQQFKAYYWPDHNTYNNWISSSGSYSITSSKGPNKYCPQEVTPLTSSKTTILNGISSMKATGMTHINMGAVWGWRMISPKWQTLWGGEMNANNLPLAYNTSMMYKVMILLTDGDNTMSNSSHTAYWYLSDGKLGTTRSSTAETKLDNRTKSTCDSMKANGVIIYTIGLGNPGTNASALLQYCASKTEYYFDTPTNEELQSAFQTIGDSLANLRISQ